MSDGLELKQSGKPRDPMMDIIDRFLQENGEQPQEQSSVNIMDYLNPNGSQSGYDANQSVDLKAMLNVGDQTVQSEQKKSGSVIEDFLGGLGKAVGSIAKVGAAVVAPTAVNAFYDQRQKMANKALADEATKFIVANQGNDFTTNDIFVHLRAANPEAFKHADISQVNRDVANAFQPVLTVDASKIQNKKQFDERYFDAWSSGKNSIDMGNGNMVGIGISPENMLDEFKKLGLNFQWKDVDERGNELYQLLNKEQLTPEKWDAVFNLAKKYKIPPEQVRRKFDLQNKPDYKMLDLEYKNNRLNFEKAKDDLKRRTGRDITYNQWLSAVDKAIKLRQTDASGTVGDTAFDDQVAQLLNRDLSSVANYVPLTEVDKKEIQKYDSEFSAALNDADALAKKFSSLAGDPEFGVNQFMNEAKTLPVMPQGYYDALDNGDTELASKYQQIHDKVATAIGNKNRRVILLKSKKVSGVSQSAPAGFSAKDLIATGKWTQQLLDIAVKQGKLKLNKDGTYSQ